MIDYIRQLSSSNKESFVGAMIHIFDKSNLFLEEFEYAMIVKI